MIINESSIQLFCLPYAGGSAAAFNNLKKAVSSNIELIAIEYPGHATRAKEEYKAIYHELVDDVYYQIKLRRNPSKKFAILGYSLGSAVSFDVILKYYEEETITHAFFCAREPLHLLLDSRFYCDLNEEEFVDKMISLGGLNTSLLRDPRFRKIHLTPLLKDYQLWSQYRYPSNAPKVKIKSTIFYSEEDTPFYLIEKWQELIDQSICFYELGYNHFFINTHYNEMGRIISKVLINT